jgi:choline dehydrogenase-like flavoprotein
MSHSRQMLHNGDAELVMDPNQWMRIFGTPMDWGFHADPNAQINGRAIPYSMGKVLGGGSSVNVCTWSRGHQADWDYYAQQQETLAGVTRRSCNYTTGSKIGTARRTLEMVLLPKFAT